MISCKVNLLDSLFLSIEFFIHLGIDGVKPVGRLLRPITPMYCVNMKESSSSFIDFVNNVRLSKPANLSIPSLNGMRFTLKHTNFSMIGMVIETTRGEMFNAASVREFRLIWDDLIRFGFRRSMDDFS